MKSPRAACLLLVAAAWLVTAVVAKPPNIVLIIGDDQRWSDYGFMGHATIQTPHLDQLALEGVVFRRGYVPTAICRPSLMSIATSRYPHEHRVAGNDPLPPPQGKGSPEYDTLRQKMIANIDGLPTLAKVLSQNGYLSHQSGKWWEGSYERGGFTHGMTRGFGQHPQGRHGDEGLTIGRQGLTPIFDFINTATENEKPFFLWYAPFMPHTPHNPPPRLLQKYKADDVHNKTARYYAMCEWFDETCGALLGYLRDNELREQTLVVFVCDNGWETAIRGQNVPQEYGCPYTPETKQSPYDGGTRTPIIFSWLGRLTPDDRIDLASSLDIMPTVLAAAGLVAPEDISGISLWRSLRDRQPIPRQRLFGEGFWHDQTDIETTESTLLYRWCIDGRWKLILSYDRPPADYDLRGHYADAHRMTRKPPQLFDLRADPQEANDLAAEHPDKIAELKRSLDEWYHVDLPIVRESS